MKQTKVSTATPLGLPHGGGGRARQRGGRCNTATVVEHDGGGRWWWHRVRGGGGGLLGAAVTIAVKVGGEGAAVWQPVSEEETEWRRTTVGQTCDGGPVGSHARAVHEIRHPRTNQLEQHAVASLYSGTSSSPNSLLPPPGSLLLCLCAGLWNWQGGFVTMSQEGAEPVGPELGVWCCKSSCPCTEMLAAVDLHRGHCVS
jgi:hypothetical protein